ncbi:MAG: hypothetical protein WBF99_06465 [Xanthobacteraceae bacterium]
MLAVGDSLTASPARWIARVVERATALPAGVQPVFVGTQGSGAVKHEGHSGKTIDWFLNGEDSPWPGGNFGDYFASNSVPIPDVVVWALGTNDVFGYMDDATLVADLPTMMNNLDLMIATLASSNASMKHLICLPIPAAESQEGFGNNYSWLHPYARYQRNLAMFWQSLVGKFASREADGIFLIPANSVADTKHGFELDADQPVSDYIKITGTYATYAAMVADLAPADGELFYVTDVAHYFGKVGPSTKGGWRPANEDDGIVRPIIDPVHPFRPGLSAFEQWGDLMWAAFNVLKAKALI